MEYYLVRAMEVCRLTEDQLFRLQEHEKKERVMKGYDPKTNTFASIEPKSSRCLMPHEIQEVFKLCTLKEQYGIPELDAPQSIHNQRLRMEFRKLNLAPEFGISPLDVEKVHSFDENVREADRSGKLNLAYQGASKRMRATDEMEN